MLHATALFCALQRDLTSFSTPFAEALLRSHFQPSCSSSSSAAQAATVTGDAAVSNTVSGVADVLQLLEAAITARQKVCCTSDYTSM
jgi:hypothetical protein